MPSLCHSTSPRNAGSFLRTDIRTAWITGADPVAGYARFADALRSPFAHPVSAAVALFAAPWKKPSGGLLFFFNGFCSHDRGFAPVCQAAFCFFPVLGVLWFLFAEHEGRLYRYLRPRTLSLNATSIGATRRRRDRLFRLTSQPMRFPPQAVIGCSPFKAAVLSSVCADACQSQRTGVFKARVVQAPHGGCREQ